MLYNNRLIHATVHLPKNKIWLNLFWLIPMLCCQQKQSQPMIFLQSIRDNQLYFSDGSTAELPNPADRNQVTIFMVRHAEKDQNDPQDPDLTPEGRARAERLGSLMAEAGLDSIFSTPFQRCIQTANPAKRLSGLTKIIPYQPTHQIELLDGLIGNLDGRRYLLVGHQHTVPMALNYLKGSFDYRNLEDYEFGKLFIAVCRGEGNTEVRTCSY